MISESEDYSAKLPDLLATAIGYEYPGAAISHISESAGPPSSFLVETHSDINISEDIESPDMSPFTTDEEEVPLTNQHLQAVNYRSKSTRANCSHTERESASDHELPGVLNTVVLGSSDSEMELSEDNNSSNNLPQISGVLDTVVMGSSDTVVT